MIIKYDFGIGLKEYGTRGIENEFPVLERCPSCNCYSEGNLHRNGYYWRYGITEEDGEFYIPICRIRCQACKVNISILPDFLIPYFQSTLHTIVERVNRFLKGEKVNDGRRQLFSQHIRRFLEILHWIHSFFVDIGQAFGFSNDKKKEAQKYMTMILDIGVSSFFRRSWGHLSSYFMGKLILPYLRYEKNNIIPT